MRGLINRPIFIFSSIFSSMDFLKSLNGIIDLQDGNVNDWLFLHRVARSLTESIGNDQTLRSSINELRLNLYPSGKAEPWNLDKIIQLISKCANLKVFNLQTLGHGNDDSGFKLPNHDNPLLPIGSIMENLEEVSLKSNDQRWLLHIDFLPVIEFKQLKSLRLIWFCVESEEAWIQLMKPLQKTLMHLDLYLLRSKMPYVLPFPMEKLRSIHVKANTRIGIEHMNQCLELTDVNLEVFSTNVEEFRQLNVAANVNMNISVPYISKWQDEDYGHLQNLLNVSGPKIVYLVFDFDNSPMMTNAMRHAIANCPDLVSLNIRLPIRPPGDLQNWQQSMAVLQTFFDDRQRASKLRNLCLIGPFKAQILGAMFAYCSNLKKLDIRNCPLLTNAHLISWVNDEIKLRQLHIIDCGNITDQGLIPLVIACGDNLTNFAFRPATDQLWNDKRLWNILAYACPNLKNAAYLGGDKETKKKFLNQGIFKDENNYFLHG